MSVVKEIVDANPVAPAYVRFERRVVENKAATRTEGRWVGKDVDYVTVIPPNSGGKQEWEQKCSNWIEQMQADVDAGRLPKAWRDRYLAEYAAWQNGQELPLQGTPIKGWGILSPAQQEMLIRAHIRTVEELSLLNEEGMRQVGMGSFDLRNKAVAWLAQLKDKGPLTVEMAAIQQQNAILKGSVETLERQVSELVAAIKATQAVAAAPPAHAVEITAAEILPEEI